MKFCTHLAHFIKYLFKSFIIAFKKKLLANEITHQQPLIIYLCFFIQHLKRCNLNFCKSYLKHFVSVSIRTFISFHNRHLNNKPYQNMYFFHSDFPYSHFLKMLFQNLHCLYLHFQNSVSGILQTY